MLLGVEMVQGRQSFILTLSRSVQSLIVLKDLYPCPIKIINGLTDKEQFQYLTGLKGPKEGPLYHSSNEFIITSL